MKLTAQIHATVFILFLQFEKLQAFDLTIFHTNDVHVRFEQFNKRFSACKEKDIAENTCYGGAARRKTALDQLRSQHSPSLLLDGGDQFQGGLWYTVFTWKPIALIMRYDAMAFGNHEFDSGLKGLAPFLQNTSSDFPVVNSNIDASDSEIEGLFLPAYTKTVGGEEIGIVGYTTEETSDISYPGKTISFNNVIDSLKSAVKELVDDGKINKIIAIGHAGIRKDREICQKVRGIDIVIGGHTNTFLYTGTPPTNDVPEGVYPEVYNETGNPCLVIQDYAYGKYLGFLQTEFDSKGILTSWSGNPILMDNAYSEDQEILDLLQPYKGFTFINSPFK